MRIAQRLGSGRSMRLLGSLLTLLAFLPVSTLAAGRTAGAQVPGLSAVAQGLEIAAEQNIDYMPGEVLVKLRAGSAFTSPLFSGMAGSAFTSPLFSGMMECFGLQASGEVLPGVYKLTSSEGARLDAQAAADALVSTGVVEYAQPNNIYQMAATPNDEQYAAGQQWSVTQIKAEQAWDITTGSTDMVIAILDTGTAVNHPDLEEKIVQGYDFINNDNNPSDDQGHGTMTAGIAAASSNNGIGITGISWGARIMPVKVLSGDGRGSDETVARGIRWAVDNGARILNLSLGGAETSDIQDDAIRYAHDRNVLVVAAAGNTPDGKPHYPAAYDTVLSVGATGRSDTVTGFSSYGPYVDVSAPGVGILSSSWDDGRDAYEYGNGTSFSCPLVTGAAALVWSANPSLTADDVRFILEDSSDDVGPAGWDEYSGRGRLNVFRAVQMAQQGKPAPRTPTPASQPTNTPVPTATGVPGQGPALQVDSKQPAPGALLAILGSGFAPNEIVELALQTSDGGGRSLGAAQTNAQGGFRAEVALPRDIPLGKATLSGTGSVSKLHAAIELTLSQGGGNGQSIVRGVVRGATNPAALVVRLKPSLGVSGPEMSTIPDAAGAYTFAGLTSGIYSLSVSGNGALPAGPFTVQVDGTGADIKTIDITMAGARPKGFDSVPSVPNTATQVYFNDVGHTLKGPFLKFWQQNGGLAIFGFPISEEFPEVSATDGKTYTVQYFERNRFEYHPEFAGTPNEVLMGLLGIEIARGRTFPPGAAFESTQDRVYFKETSHSLSGPFLKYWRENGGLPIFGYPISEELMENGYLVQYFERNRFEHHPEFAGSRNEVLLGLLGVEIAKRNGWVAP